jgi:hypothetical protein
MVHYQMFAILQQLKLVPSNRLFPSLRSLIPFSAYSPLQIPSRPASLTLIPLASWAVVLAGAIAPFGLVLAYNSISSVVSSIIYGPVYRRLPRPVNPKEGHHTEPMQTLSEMINIPPESLQLNPSNDTDGNITNSDDTSAPTQHTATLDALEGRPSHHDDSSDDGEHELSGQAMITFDVEATDLSEAPVGTWSAELRSVNEPPRKEIPYPITALTMLPPLLAAEALSTGITTIVMLPLEAIMVRTLARSFRQSANLSTGDMFSGVGLTWRVISNILTVHALECVVTGSLWAAFIVGSEIIEGKFVLWGKKDTAEEEELEFRW